MVLNSPHRDYADFLAHGMGLVSHEAPRLRHMGKTTTFKKLLERLTAGTKDNRLVSTFISRLTRDLDSELGDYARVRTFHGFCFRLLKRNANVTAAANLTFADLPDFGSMSPGQRMPWLVGRLADSGLPMDAVDLEGVASVFDAGSGDWAGERRPSAGGFGVGGVG